MSERLLLVAYCDFLTPSLQPLKQRHCLLSDGIMFIKDSLNLFSLCRLKPFLSFSFYLFFKVLF
jgi:hypothetical protein